MRKSGPVRQKIKRASSSGRCARCGRARGTSSAQNLLCPTCLSFLQEGGGRGRAPGPPLAPVGAQLSLWDVEDDLRREGSAVCCQGQAVGHKSGG